MVHRAEQAVASGVLDELLLGAGRERFMLLQKIVDGGEVLLPKRKKLVIRILLEEVISVVLLPVILLALILGKVGDEI